MPLPLVGASLLPATHLPRACQAAFSRHGRCWHLPSRDAAPGLDIICLPASFAALLSLGVAGVGRAPGGIVFRRTSAMTAGAVSLPRLQRHRLRACLLQPCFHH